MIASATASPAAAPEPIAKFTPSSQTPAASVRHAASPATTIPSAGEVGHRVDAALGDEVRRVLEQLGAADERGDAGVLLEVGDQLLGPPAALREPGRPRTRPIAIVSRFV